MTTTQTNTSAATPEIIPEGARGFVLTGGCSAAGVKYELRIMVTDATCPCPFATAATLAENFESLVVSDDFDERWKAKFELLK